jgi:excisionase family DNA binding protein
VSFGIYWSSLWREVPGVDDEILTIRELAALLKIGEKTAYTMAQSGELPGFKVRDQWRFRRADIDAWIDKQVRSSDESDVANQREEDP